MGLMVPSLGSIANSTVHLKPWCLAKIFASCGKASSDRYSSSPLTRTMCLPLPGPSYPSKTIHGSAPRTDALLRLAEASNVPRTREYQVSLGTYTLQPSFQPGLIRSASLDLKNRATRIARDQALVLAVHEQIQVFKHNRTDEGRFALRFDDRGKGAAPP